jgi:hypothetical protein
LSVTRDQRPGITVAVGNGVLTQSTLLARATPLSILRAHKIHTGRRTHLSIEGDMRQDRIEQWSRYVRATGIDAMFVGEEWADYLSTQVYYAAARGQERTLCQLLDQGANPDWYHPQDGLTPLQVTVRLSLSLSLSLSLNASP